MRGAHAAVGLGVLVAGCVALGSACNAFDGASTPTADGGETSATGGDASALPPVNPPRAPDLDAGTDGAGDARSETSGPWTPAQIAGLALWLDADDVTADINGRTATWLDKSTKNNHATTTTMAQQPVVLTGGSSFNTHKGLRFDGAATFFTIAEAASLKWTQSFVFEVVFRHAPATKTEGGAFFNKSAGAVSPGVILYMSTLLATGYPVDVELAVSQGKFVQTDGTNHPITPDVIHRLRAAWDSSTHTASIQVDKDAPVTGVQTAVPAYDAPGLDVLIGKTADNQYLKADVAEIIAISAATVDPNDITKLQTYLDTKYGL